jgi:hypothetical protein
MKYQERVEELKKLNAQILCCSGTEGTGTTLPLEPGNRSYNGSWLDVNYISQATK